MTINSALVKISRLFLAATFIISAAAKVYSMHFFDGLVAGQLIGADFYDHQSSYFWVQVLTRVIIAGEFMLGVAVLQKKFLKQLTLPVMGFLLIVFSVQVIYEASFNGRGYVGGNCGCFGEVIPFDNLQTLIKNGVLLLLVGLVYSLYRDIEEMVFGSVVPPIMVGLFTFFTMYLTIETFEKEDLESGGGAMVQMELETDVKLEASFDSQFPVGVVGAEMKLRDKSLLSKKESLNTKMWFLLPGAETDSVFVKPGSEINVKYLKEGAFDVTLIVQEEGSSDTLVKKGFFNVQETGLSAVEKERIKEQKLKLELKEKQRRDSVAMVKKLQKEMALDKASVFAPYANKWSNGKFKDLDKGTHVICMFSATCGHCQAAYREIVSARSQKSIAQPYILAYGSSYDLEAFWRRTGNVKAPHVLIEKYAEFSSLLKGGGFPRIIVVENGKQVKVWDESFKPGDFKSYFGIKEVKEVPKSDELDLDLGGSEPALDLGGGQGVDLDLK